MPSDLEARLRDALTDAFNAMDAACKWAAGETAGVKTIEDANRHTAGYDALLDATVKVGQAAGILSGGVAILPSDSLDAAWRAAEEALPPNRDLVVGRWPDTETTIRYFARAVVPGAPVGYGPNLAAALLDLAARLKEADHG